MNCAEFQEVLPEVIEGGRNAEQESHLRACPMCSGLVADLDMIASEARHLQEIAEPSPRVWNSIEIALRQEGIIRDPQLRPALTRPRLRSWSLAWLAPLAAVLLVGFSIAVYQRGSGGSTFSENVGTTPPGTVAKLQTGKEPSSANKIEDDQLLAAVAPAMQAQYASNLQNVNAYIQDAEESAKADPNDEEAQQIVMDAYEQRAAVYEMALDRSLP
jgi:hypothetical protein